MCENKGIRKVIQLICMQQQTTKATNMVGKIRQVGKISLLSVQKEKVGFFLLCFSSVLTGWSRFLTLTADTASFGEGIAECCPWASAAHPFPAETDCCRSSLHSSALSLTAESQRKMHHSCWGKQHKGWWRKGEVRRKTEDLIQSTKENLCKGHQGPPYHCGAE